jgi:YD repeat-containing protein
MKSHFRKSVAFALAGLGIAAMSVAHAATASQETEPVAHQSPVRSAASDLRVVDAEVVSRGVPFSLTRFYHWDPAATPGLLGKGWKLSLEARLEVFSTTVVLNDADGTKVTFTKQSDGTYSAPEGTAYKLTATDGGYSLTSDSGNLVRNFDGTGRLSTVVNGSGEGLKLTYTATGQIVSVSDAEGRVARFNTSSTGLLLTVTLADGGRVTYVYTNEGYLARVADVVGKVRTYSYDSQGRLIQN